MTALFSTGMAPLLRHSCRRMGKASRRHHCSATQRMITNAECATNRISNYSCQPDCIFNPFSSGHYYVFRKIERNVTSKTLSWLVNSSTDPARTVSEIKDTTGKTDLDRYAYLLSEFFFKRDASGRTCAERREGFSEARVWIDKSMKPLAIGKTTKVVSGRVLLGQGQCRLEAIGHEQLSEFKARFESAMGDRVRSRGEEFADFSEKLKSEEPDYDRELVPPRLLAESENTLRSSICFPTSGQAPIESDIRVTEGRAWLDKQQPVLDGKTPREAAVDPALRPKLIKLLKECVRRCDERNLETGGSEDINWMLEELGAHEIIFDPPPPRAKPQDGDDTHYHGDHSQNNC